MNLLLFERTDPDIQKLHQFITEKKLPKLQHHDRPVIQLWLQEVKKLLQGLNSRRENSSGSLKVS